MTAKRTFDSLVKTQLVPLIRMHGFQGSGAQFVRRLGPVVQVVTLRTRGQATTVHLGVHHEGLGLSKRAKPTAQDCPLRVQLEDFAGNDSFGFGSTKAHATSSVTAMTEMMKVEGLRFFAALEPDALPAQIKHLARAGYEAFAPLGPAGPPETWATLASHLRDARSAKAFAAQAKRRDRRFAEARRRRDRIDRIINATTWPALTYDCVEEACQALDRAAFQAWVRALGAAREPERMGRALAHLKAHHPDVVRVVKVRRAHAYGS